MRRIIHYIAIAVLTLVGPVEVARTMAGPAEMTCLCGCGVAATEPCECPTKPTTPSNQSQTGSHGAGESSCTPTNAPCPSNISTGSTRIAGESQDEAGRTSDYHPEPTTWARALDVPALVGTPISAHGRDPDLGRHLAQLSTFRI